MKVLIAEDNQISRKILEKNIKNWGYEVLIAKNGEKAWQAFQSNKIRLAILDWMMPEIDGVELCRKIRKKKDYNYTYIIILTSKDRQEDIIKGLSAGADDYMIKPFNSLELRARLQNGRRIIELEDKLLKSQKKLRELAARDSLTELWNRTTIFKLFEEELERSKREKYPTGAIMIDIDNFKGINDSLGHFIGDNVLVEVSSRLKKRARIYDKIGRYGGDEFLIILPKCGQLEVKKIADRLRLAICEKKIKTSKSPLAITISMGGVSSEILSCHSIEELIQACDMALYKAKKKGRNCVILAK